MLGAHPAVGLEGDALPHQHCPLHAGAEDVLRHQLPAGAHHPVAGQALRRHAHRTSGLPGGLFSPSLSVGAGLGAAISGFLPSVDMSTIMLLTTAAYFSAVVQSPLTAFVIVTEMTVSNGLLVPLLATTFIAAGISNILTREPLYHALSHQF